MYLLKPFILESKMGCNCFKYAYGRNNSEYITNVELF